MSADNGSLFASLKRCAADDRYSNEFVGMLARRFFAEDQSRPSSELGLIPGPDPGACPKCGGWIKAGMTHDCEAHRKRLADDAAELVALWETQS